MLCDYCGSSRVKVSRFRIIDLVPLLIVRYPLRCHHCSHRMFVFIPVAWRIYRAERLRQRLAKRGTRMKAEVL
jgi:DNA-directed RNA polymerase subunit RPC12/RpoP